MIARAPLEASREARDRAIRDREHRELVLRAARASRKKSRELRERALEQRNMGLEQRWAIWLSNGLAGPPSYIPPAWETEVWEATLLDRIALETGRTSRAIRRLALEDREPWPPTVESRLPAVVALCETASERLPGPDPTGTGMLVGACARALDGLAAELADGPASPRAVALAATCRASSQLLRRALVQLHRRRLFS